MKCRKQFKYHRLAIANTWEVHLDVDLWNRIIKASDQMDCTLTWITRYCVFRLVRKKNLYMRKAMKIHSNKIKNHYKKNQQIHRHQLCLYGNDEMLLRIAAMQLGITVSHLIRMSLHWFLPKIEKSLVKWHEIFYYGTKICRYLSFNRKNMLKIPYYEILFYEKWSQKDWWNRPGITIPIPYTPSIDDLRNMDFT